MFYTTPSILRWPFFRRKQRRQPTVTDSDKIVEPNTTALRVEAESTNSTTSGPPARQASTIAVSKPSRTEDEFLEFALKAAGFKTFTAFVEHWPLLSIAELAPRLGCAEWTLHRRLIAESEAWGHHAVGYLVRSLLVRHLNLPGKQIPIRSWSLEVALCFIAGMLPPRYRSACLRVAFGLPRIDLDEAWKPDCASDAVLVQVFGCYWDPPFARRDTLEAPNAAASDCPEAIEHYEPESRTDAT